MPSVARHSSAMPTVISTSSSRSSGRSVGFMKDPVTAVSRPVTVEESWALYHFEMHAKKCAYCHDPYEVHRHHDQLCEVGHRLAQDVAYFVYNKSDGETYSTEEEGRKVVRVEIPSGYDEVRSLLKAIERSLRHRSRRPFVSMDRTYYVAARVPQRSRSVKIEQFSSSSSSSKIKSRPRSGEIVDWPEAKPTFKPVLTEINTNAKRGSLYEQDIAIQRRNEKKYNVEVRQPTARDIFEHRLSGYYR